MNFDSRFSFTAKPSSAKRAFAFSFCRFLDVINSYYLLRRSFDGDIGLSISGGPLLKLDIIVSSGLKVDSWELGLRGLAKLAPI